MATRLPASSNSWIRAAALPGPIEVRQRHLFVGHRQVKPLEVAFGAELRQPARVVTGQLFGGHQGDHCFGTSRLQRGQRLVKAAALAAGTRREDQLTGTAGYIEDVVGMGHAGDSRKSD